MRAIVAGIAFACAACSTFASAGAPDGGTASATDAGATPTDAGTTPPAEARCKGTRLVSDDFNRANGAVVAPPWQDKEGTPAITSGGTDGTALTASLGAATDGELFARVVFATTELSAYCIELDMMVNVTLGSYALGSFTELLAIEDGKNDPVYVELLPTAPVLSVGKDSKPIPLAFDSWNHVTLQASRTGNIMTYAVTVAQANAAVSGPVTISASASDVLPTPAIRLGAHSWKGAGAVTMIADNFVMTTP